MQPPAFDRAAAKRAGYSDAEIDAFLAQQAPKRPSLGSFAAESSAMQGPGKAPARAASDVSNAKGLARAAAQGATFGFADEAEAGVRALGGADYKTARDKIRSENEQYMLDNPGKALTANLAGGVLSGAGMAKLATLLPMLKTAGLAANASATATTGQRIAQGAKMGAAAGALTGAGTAPELSDVPKYVGGGLVGGAVLGTAVSGAAEGVRGARNLVGRVGQGQLDTPEQAAARGMLGRAGKQVRKAIQAESPEQAAARRIFGRMGKQGQTLDSVTGDEYDTLGEMLGTKGVRDIRLARMRGYTAPQMIEESLTTRARNDVGRVKRLVTDELGPQVDDVALQAEKLREAQTTSKPFYDEALEGVRVADERVPTWAKRPAIASAWRDAERLAANDGQTMPSLRDVLGSGRSRAGNLADETIGGVRTRGAGRADAAGDDVRNMTQEQLRAVRRGGPLETMTDADLEAERLYLLQEQGADQARAAIRESPDYAEYLALRDAGNFEDARGVLERMGYNDLREFNQNIGRDAAKAAANIPNRAERIAAVESELQRRTAAGPARSVPGRGAVSLPEPDEAATLPQVYGRHLQYVKLALRDKLASLEGLSGGTPTTEYAQTQQALDDIDNLLYEFGNRAEDGTNLWGKANATYAKPMQERDAFVDGMRGGRQIQPVDESRLLGDGMSAWRAKGVANTLQDDLAKLRTGDVGARIDDPAPMLMGSDAANARLRVAANGNAEKVARIQNTAKNVSKRLQTRQTVIGGSQTADKLSDAAEANVAPGDVIAGARSPLSALLNVVGRGANGLARNTLGQDMDATAKLLMAGAPGQMTVAEAKELLRRMEPQLIERMRRQLIARGAVTQSGLGAVSGRGR